MILHLLVIIQFNWNNELGVFIFHSNWHIFIHLNKILLKVCLRTCRWDLSCFIRDFSQWVAKNHWMVVSKDTKQLLLSLIWSYKIFKYLLDFIDLLLICLDLTPLATQLHHLHTFPDFLDTCFTLASTEINITFHNIHYAATQDYIVYISR